MPVKFINDNFSRFLLPSSGNPERDAILALSSSYYIMSKVEDKTKKKANSKKVEWKLNEDGSFLRVKTDKVSRITSGWAIIRDSGSSMQTILVDKPGIDYDDSMTVVKAFYQELKNWDESSPRMFLTFAKATFSVDSLVRTLDKRHVCICSAKTVDIFDFTQPPTEDSCSIFHAIWKEKMKDEEGSV